MEVTSHTWRLSDPGMDLLERAGLAGLHMALAAATDADHSLSPLTWTDEDLTDDSVTVRWTGPPKPGFEELIKWAWQVRDGVLYFPAVHDDRDLTYWWNRVPMHVGITRTFLQHGLVQPKGKETTRIIRTDEDKEISVRFKPLSRLKPHADLQDLFLRGLFREEGVELSSWVSPGHASRYPSDGRKKNWKDKPWRGDAKRALLLMLAQTACLYMRLQGKGNNWVAVVPDVRNLGLFASVRRRLYMSPEWQDVASLGDAGLRFASDYATRAVRRDLSTGCRVLAMGTADYYEPTQSIRKSVLDVSAQLNSIRRYRRLHSAFPMRFIPSSADQLSDDERELTKPEPPKATDLPKGNGWYKLPTGRGRIADNLANNRPWYRSLLAPLVWDEEEVKRIRGRHPGYSAERLWFTVLSRQREKFMALVDAPDMWDDPRDKTFVDAFWETLRALYRKEAKAAAERGGSRSVKERWKHMIEDVRRKLMEAKTQRTSRAALAELFARAGTQATLAAHTATVWRLMEHPEHWEKGRDLALLAMVSYRSKKQTTNGHPSSKTTPT